MIKRLSDDDLKMIVGGVGDFVFDDILPVPGEGSGGGPLNTPDPDPFDWDLPDGMEKYGESLYL